MPVKNDTYFRHLKAGEKDYKRSDGGGLFMLVTKTGSKLWRYAYNFDSKQKLLALGQYPVTSLADARIKRDDAKKLLAEGIDPSVNRKDERRNARMARANTFEAVAKELMDKFEAEGDAPKTLKKKQWLLDFANKEFGKRPIAEMKAPEILDALRKIEKRGRYETATRARSTIGAVFRFAIATGRAERDPTADLRGALIAPTVTHRATIVEPKAVGALLRAIDGFEGHAVTRYALKLAPLVFVRPGELRQAEWAESNVFHPSPVTIKPVHCNALPIDLRSNPFALSHDGSEPIDNCAKNIENNRSDIAGIKWRHCHSLLSSHVVCQKPLFWRQIDLQTFRKFSVVV